MRYLHDDSRPRLLFAWGRKKKMERTLSVVRGGYDPDVIDMDEYRRMRALRQAFVSERTPKTVA